MNKEKIVVGKMLKKYGLVTGGTQGLGEAVVRKMLDEGAEGVAFCGRNAELGAKLVAELGSRALYVQADLENVQDCKKFVATAVSEFGTVDSVVSCGASTKRGTAEETSQEIWDHLFNTNLRGAFFVMQSAINEMKKRKNPGAIAIVGSMQAYGGAPFLLPYATTKGALMTLTKGLANALLWDRIKVNMINIGWTNTPNEHRVQTIDHGRSQNWLAEVSTLQPYGRLIEVEEVAKAVLFMVSEESGMMSGAIIDFDQQVIGTMRDNPGI